MKFNRVAKIFQEANFVAIFSSIPLMLALVIELEFEAFNEFLDCAEGFRSRVGTPKTEFSLEKLGKILLLESRDLLEELFSLFEEVRETLFLGEF